MRLDGSYYIKVLRENGVGECFVLKELELKAGKMVTCEAVK